MFILLQAYLEEDTPLHILMKESCDEKLARILLEQSGQCLATIPNRQVNTALHLACGRNTLPLSVQKNVVKCLLHHGAMIHLKNINGYVPSVLVDGTRKQV